MANNLRETMGDWMPSKSTEFIGFKGFPLPPKATILVETEDFPQELAARSPQAFGRAVMIATQHPAWQNLLFHVMQIHMIAVDSVPFTVNNKFSWPVFRQSQECAVPFSQPSIPPIFTQTTQDPLSPAALHPTTPQPAALRPTTPQPAASRPKIGRAHV